jgi:putative ABC transport system permease protein
MGNFVQDVRFGLRVLAKNPGFTAVAVLTLALGIGANTAMFSVVYGVLLRPLPYPHAERIVKIARTFRGQVEDANFTARAFDFWRDHSKPFEAIAAATGVGFNLVGAGRPERIDALRVSTQYFDVYGVQPFLGRGFSAEEDRLGGPKVAILSYDLWQEHFNGGGNAVGRSIFLDGIPYTVIGVMPAGFASIPPVALWTTIGQVRESIGGGQNYDVIARLKPDVSVKRGSSFLASLTQPFAQQFYQWVPERDRKLISFTAAPYRYVVSEDVRTPLLVLFGAIGFVLLIACVNVANLLLARTASRNREIALRTALGAGRGRIFRQLLTESVLLALFGAALGLLVAYWGLHSLLALAPDVLPRAQHVGLNGWALIFTAGVALLTGILFGVAPAFQASRTNLNEALKEGEGRASFSLRRRRLSAGMVSAEIALSLILLIGSGLLIRTFARLLRSDIGFNPHQMLTLQIWTMGSKYRSMPALAGFYQGLLRRIEAIPGVRTAAIVAAGLPLERGGNVNPGVRVGGGVEYPSVDYREITPGYFHTLGVPLLAGRPFTLADAPDSAKVTMINAAFAHRYFHDQNPLGRHLILGHLELEIVGVAGDVRSSLNEPAPPTFFVPITQASFDDDQLFQGWFPTSLLVRTAVKPLTLGRAVANAVRDADPNIPIGHIQSMDEVLSTSLALRRLLVMLMSVFGALALLLAAVGIYGVISYSVSQRTNEIGIRMALGAQRGDVLRLVVGQGFVLVLTGVAVGIAASFGLTRFMTSLLYGVKPTDAVTFVVVSVLLTAVALGASYIPARRAAKVDPMAALRYE